MRGSTALLDELLARQGRSHGLRTYTPCAADEAEPSLARLLDEEYARLDTFAGLRREEASPAQATPAGEEEEEQAARPGGGVSASGCVSPLAEEAESVEALCALGLDVLKAELARLGLKRGGSLQARTLAHRVVLPWCLTPSSPLLTQERAQRLFQLKGVKKLDRETHGHLFADTSKASRAKQQTDPAPHSLGTGKRLVDTHGPLLPGAKRPKRLTRV